MDNKGYTEKDWKLFRKKIGGWQENYMDKLNREYIDLLNENKPASEKFWELESRIKQDKKQPGVQLEMSRSQLVFNIFNLLEEGVITFDELDEFSDELRGQINCD